MRTVLSAVGFEMSYGEAGRRVEELAELYRQAGYGVGHRVATLLENRPEHVLHTLALNTIGVCCVPINPDYRAAEIAYLVDHSEPELILALGERQASIEQALAQSTHRPRVVVAESVAGSLRRKRRSRRATRGPSPRRRPASLYLRHDRPPKGCILSHGYELGAWYAALGGIAGLRTAEDRIYNPLPLYHANAGVVSLMGAIVTGNCQIQPDRFHPQRWWREVAETGATSSIISG